MSDLTPIFSIGCMRSGTTVVGAFIGTAPSVLNVGELGAFYFSTYTAQHKYAKAPSKFKQQYLDLLKTQSQSFIEKICRENGVEKFVEDTPWNTRIIPELEAIFPNAIYIMSVRHYAGVIQSMRTSWTNGYTWAGPTDVERASLWAEFNDYIDLLPKERTVFISYDRLCAEPEVTLTDLEAMLLQLNISGPFDRSIFSVTHASKSDRPTPIIKDESGSLVYRPIPTINPLRWSEADEKYVSHIVMPICRKIKQISGIDIKPMHNFQTQEHNSSSS